MKFPLAEYVGLIEFLHKIIPDYRNITKEEINEIKNFYLDGLKAYIYYTYPKILSDHSEINKFIQACRDIFEELPDDSLIIAPGDSPARIVRIIDLFYKTGDNQYVNNKSMNIVNFPLSSSYRTITDDLIDNYVEGLIKFGKITLSFNNIIYLDYVGGGNTYKLLLNSLRRVTGNSNLTMSMIDIKSYLDVGEMFFCLISAAENMEARYMPIYRLEYKCGDLNLFRANAIISYLYLSAFTNLELDRYSPADLLNVFPRKIYNITYYSIPKRKFISDIIYYQERIDDTVTVVFLDGKEICISINTIVSLDEWGSSTSLCTDIDPGFISVTLINGAELKGYYDGNMLDIGDGKGLMKYTPFFITINATKIKLIDNPETIDIKEGYLYKIEYYNNGTLNEDIVYVKWFYLKLIEYITKDNFVVQNRDPESHWMHSYLIKSLERISTDSPIVTGTIPLKYKYDNEIRTHIANWITKEHYYETANGTLMILRPLILIDEYYKIF